MDKLANKMKISWIQVFFLYLSIRVAVFAVSLPSITAAPYPNRDLWLVPFLVAPAALLIGTIAVKLGAFFPRQTLIEYSKTLTGPFIGTVIAILYAWWYIYIAAINLRISSDFFLTAFLPDTPISLLAGAVVLTAAYAARQGYRVLAHVNQVLVPWMIALIWVLFFLTLQQLRLVNLTPVLAGGIQNLVLNAIVPATLFSDIINIAMITPYMTNPAEMHKVVKWGVLVSAFHLLVILFTVITFLGIDAASGSVYPGLDIARRIDVADFIQRVEIAIVVVWLAGVFIRITLALIWASLAISQGFKLRSYELLVLPLALVVTVIAFLLGDNTLEYSALFKPGFIAPFYLTYSLVIPLLLLLLAYLKVGRPSQPGTPVSPGKTANESTDLR